MKKGFDFGNSGVKDLGDLDERITQYILEDDAGPLSGRKFYERREGDGDEFSLLKWQIEFCWQELFVQLFHVLVIVAAHVIDCFVVSNTEEPPSQVRFRDSFR